jgi:preprotein translocase subunit YajC
MTGANSMSFVHFLPALHSMIVLASKSSKPKSNDDSAFLFILLILAVGAFLFMRPQRRRQREQQAMQRAVSVGDEVVTSSGIVGTIRAMNDDRVLVEIAPGTTVEIVRRAIGTRVPQAPAYPDDVVSTPPPPTSPPPEDNSGFPPPVDDRSKESDQPAPSFPAPSPKPDPDSEQSQAEEGKSA